MRGWMLSLMIGASGAQAASFRPDLIKAAPVFCGETTSSLIEARVSDAQIELAMVKDVSDLASFAEGFAKDNGHHGFAFGSCADHRQWIVSTPAPAAVMVQREKDLVIASDKLRSVCATYDVDGLKAETNQPVALIHADKPTGGTRILTLKDDFTTLSLTCHPLDKSQDGPELWTLIALRTEGTPKINSAAELVEWIQNQRRHDHLPALSIGNKSLQGLVDKAAQQRDLHHPHALLLKEKQKLKSQKIDLLGEDRVSARDFSAIANLLWNSPQHRRLLLNPRANAIVLNVSDRENQKFVVMILANL